MRGTAHSLLIHVQKQHHIPIPLSSRGEDERLPNLHYIFSSFAHHILQLRENQTTDCVAGRYHEIPLKSR